MIPTFNQQAVIKVLMILGSVLVLVCVVEVLCHDWIYQGPQKEYDWSSAWEILGHSRLRS